MPAKPLTPEQKADAERLMALFKQQKGLTQAVLADELGFSNQSAVNQYLNGKIPLNIEAAIKFAGRFDCRVADFSPAIQAEINRIARYSFNQSDSDSTKRIAEKLHIYNLAPEETQAVVDFILFKGREQSPGWVDSDARAYADSLEAKARRWLNGKRRSGPKEASA